MVGHKNHQEMVIGLRDWGSWPANFPVASTRVHMCLHSTCYCRSYRVVPLCMPTLALRHTAGVQMPPNQWNEKHKLQKSSIDIPVSLLIENQLLVLKLGDRGGCKLL
jgi:hypothetical protein